MYIFLVFMMNFLIIRWLIDINFRKRYLFIRIIIVIKLRYLIWVMDLFWELREVVIRFVVELKVLVRDREKEKFFFLIKSIFCLLL